MRTEGRPLAPLPDEEWPANLSAVAETLGEVLNVHRVLAHHPDLLRAWMPLREHLVRGSSLPVDVREVVILRVAHHLDNDYERHHHVARGRDAGLTDDDLARIEAGPAVDGWSPTRRTALIAVDELVDAGRLSVPTARALEDVLGRTGLLDLLFTVGTYVTLGYVLSTCDVPIDRGGVGR